MVEEHCSRMACHIQILADFTPAYSCFQFLTTGHCAIALSCAWRGLICCSILFERNSSLTILAWFKKFLNGPSLFPSFEFCRSSSLTLIQTPVCKWLFEVCHPTNKGHLSWLLGPLLLLPYRALAMRVREWRSAEVVFRINSRQRGKISRGHHFLGI